MFYEAVRNCGRTSPNCIVKRHFLGDFEYENQKDFGYVCSRRGYRSGFDGGKRGRIGRQEIRKVLPSSENHDEPSNRLP